jgi:hypothetical protein
MPESIPPVDYERLRAGLDWWWSLTDEERRAEQERLIEEFVEGERHGSDAEVFGTRPIQNDGPEAGTGLSGSSPGVASTAPCRENFPPASGAVTPLVASEDENESGP